MHSQTVRTVLPVLEARQALQTRPVEGGKRLAGDGSHCGGRQPNEGFRRGGGGKC